MTYENIPYKSFCWVLGTTSFRTAQLNLRIEEQLILLDAFKTKKGKLWRWEGNPLLQAEFYDYLKDHGALVGDASRKDKDARQKTSGLVTLGLTTPDRVLTEAGLDLVTVAKSGQFDDDNLLVIAGDSFIYLKQLLKASIHVVDSKIVKPFNVLAYLLTKFGYLTAEEFEKLVPLVIDQASLDAVVAGVGSLRAGTASTDDIVLSVLKTRTNYQQAYQLFIANAPDEDLICTIGMNRKSRSYDSVYFPIFVSLKEVFLNGDQSTTAVLNLDAAVSKLRGTARRLWRELLFEGKPRRRINSEGFQTVPVGNVFRNVTTLDELKKLFFRFLHLYKSYATLEDYADLNRRYFKLTDTLLFADNQVKFDTVPHAFFRLNATALHSEMFTESSVLTKSVGISQISSLYQTDTSTVLSALSTDIGQALSSLSEAAGYVKNERYERLHTILDERLNTDAMIELLDCFTVRDDERIAELVTDAAPPPAIFEYIVGLIWYELSGRSGDILSYMNLQLEADLMPRSHASGGGADISYDYQESSSYPAHTLLLEVTLADESNARRMEMEPVSRHLGEQIHRSGNDKDYCVFIAPEVDPNVANDFRSRKLSGYIPRGTNDQIPSLKIIPLNISQVKALFEARRGYSDAYQRFETAYQSNEFNSFAWMQELEALVSA